MSLCLVAVTGRTNCNQEKIYIKDIYLKIVMIFLNNEL